ncbi:hypothetical protein [Streptomyces sp. NPDC047070]|uniref:hypothetical protein n=1 Tax=Streptomyces sp. NPDC047070 TaxID=3154923 RepID=UPI003452FB83
MNAYAITARRLRLAADLVDARAHHRTRSLVEIVSNGFRSAAGAFEDVAADAPAVLPEELQDALDAIGLVMRAHDFHLSAALVGYAAAPVTGTLPPLNGHGAVSEGLARQDRDLQIRRRTILTDLHLDSPDGEIVAFALRALAAIHYQHEQLGAAIAVDHSRLVPAQRAATGTRDA